MVRCRENLGETQPAMTGKEDKAVVSIENSYSYVYMYSYTTYSSSFIFKLKCIIYASKGQTFNTNLPRCA